MQAPGRMLQRDSTRGSLSWFFSALPDVLDITGSEW
jgi:hypothetical protein